MPKVKIDMDQWLPKETLPDRECNLMQLWSRYHNAIQSFRGFNDKTAEGYTAALNQIKNAPAMEKSASELDAYDVWDAATSAMVIPAGKRKGELVSSSSIEKRLSAIHDIFMYLESIAVCSDLLWMPPWKLGEKDKQPDYSLSASDLKDKLREQQRELCKAEGDAARLRALRAADERSLIRAAMKHIDELDQPWFGLAVLLYLPTRLGEVCGLDLGDFRHFAAPEHSERCYIELGRAVAYHSISEKSEMKNKNAVRRTVEPIELCSLRKRYLNALRSAGVTDTDSVPAACGKRPGERCMPARLSRFVKDQLKKVVDPQDLELLALGAYIDDDMEKDREKAPLEARILRRNAFTKLTAETPLDPDSQIRPIGGHETDVEYKYVFSEDSLWDILRRIDHRMILPELHGQTWVTALDEEHVEASVCDTVRQEFVISPELLKRGGTLVINVDTDSPGDGVLLDLMRKLPPGSTVREEHYYADASTGHPDRAITDGAHWPAKKWTVSP